MRPTPSFPTLRIVPAAPSPGRAAQHDAPHAAPCAALRARSWLTALRRALPIATGVAALASVPNARAERFHWEFGGGLGRFGSVASQFPGMGAATTAAGFGLAWHVGALFNLSSSRAPLRAYLGVQHRYLSASNAGGKATLQSTYPVFRMQARHFFVSVGATPFNFGEPAGGLLSLRRVSGLLSLMGEAGLLYPITPEAAFGLAGAARYAYQGGAFQGGPAIEGSMLFRFSVGQGRRGPASDSGGAADARKFKGWRYPFGWNRGD